MDVVVAGIRPSVLVVRGSNVAEDNWTTAQKALAAVERQHLRVTVRYDGGSASKTLDDYGICLGLLPTSDIIPAYHGDFQSWLAEFLAQVPCPALADPVAACIVVAPGRDAIEAVQTALRSLTINMLVFVWVLEVEDAPHEPLNLSSSNISTDSLAVSKDLGAAPSLGSEPELHDRAENDIDPAKMRGEGYLPEKATAVESLELVRAQFGVHCGLLPADNAEATKEAVRNMVNASVVPYMEQCVDAWIHPSQAEKRGLGSRLLGFSRRLVSSAGGPPRPEYDVVGSVVATIQPRLSLKVLDVDVEAQFRRLAGMALFLRNSALAASAYDWLRRQQEQPWARMAASQELAVVSALLAGTTQPRALEPLVDAAVYTYLNRSGRAIDALRCALVSAELLVARQPADGVIAAKWLGKIIDAPALAPADRVVMQRISHAYEQRGWKRKAELWTLVAARGPPISTHKVL